MKETFLIRAALAACAVAGVVVLNVGCETMEGEPPEVPRGAYIEDKNVDVPPVTENLPNPETKEAFEEIPQQPQEPVAQPEIKKGPSDISYRVQKNDTLGSIAAIYAADQQSIATYNGLKAPYQLKPGQLLLIPASAIGITGARPIEEVGTYEAPKSANKKQDDAKPAPAGQYVTHTIGQGEYLGMIARGYGVKVNDICKANGMKDANRIRVGQKLIIPNPTKTWTKPVAAKKKVAKPAAAKSVTEKKTAKPTVKKETAPKKVESAVQPESQPSQDGPGEDDLLDDSTKEVETPAVAPETPKSEPAKATKSEQALPEGVFQCKMEVGGTLRKFAASVSIPLEKLQKLNPDLDPDTPVTEAVMVNCPY